MLEKAEKKGITVIEVLVVSGIAAMLSLILLANINIGKERNYVNVNGREIANVIREARNYSLTGRRLDNSHFPCYYLLERLDSHTCALSYVYHSGDRDCSNPSKKQSVYVFSLANGVEVGAFNNLKFNVPNGDFQSNCTKILVSKYSNYYTVCVDANGKVWEKDGNADCGC